MPRCAKESQNASFVGGIVHVPSTLITPYKFLIHSTSKTYVHRNEVATLRRFACGPGRIEDAWRVGLYTMYTWATLYQYLLSSDACYETTHPRLAWSSSVAEGLTVFRQSTSVVGIMPNATCRCSVPSTPSSTS